ncbi:unnamed protein product, partial [Mesorhabditis belari]|uniref:gamma-glutamylcyclotransferase n=1 Tax=Mesorhabditis belari TaxID=2138241 RepID=A0AAF3J6N0_9BILA
MVVNKNFFYYFAFGSNLLQERIRIQNKGAIFHNIGLLNGFRLTFVEYGERWRGGVASIIEAPDGHVWGCVWKVPFEFSDELDRQEAGYHRLEVAIESNGETIICRTYQYNGNHHKFHAPSPHYKMVIITGAREHELPEDYLKKLEAIPDNGFIGRVNVEVEAIKHMQIDLITEENM